MRLQLLQRTLDHAHRDRLAAALGLSEDFDGEPLGRVSAVSCGGKAIVRDLNDLLGSC
jgi:hypothetical protein